MYGDGARTFRAAFALADLEPAWRTVAIHEPDLSWWCPLMSHDDFEVLRDAAAGGMVLTEERRGRDGRKRMLARLP